ncbi:hypothetical protein BDP27DRAFT_1454972 [Rhodocollybia butyracea]|uniref:Uncharacterized protein n=1 Tax=Rhodocollybia butyracea TaxID=206335 RepID=A0A9P5TWB1_9AGAR|nr:hypothetical protein BDP27DRAFT_1454972 [Rhodocollybia butyracea]
MYFDARLTCLTPNSTYRKFSVQWILFCHMAFIYISLLPVLYPRTLLPWVLLFVGGGGSACTASFGVFNGSIDNFNIYCPF